MFVCLNIKNDFSHDDFNVSNCEYWQRIEENHPEFTEANILGCCLDCENRTIEYWIDDKKIEEATFEDVNIGEGMTPALSVTGIDF